MHEQKRNIADDPWLIQNPWLEIYKDWTTFLMLHILYMYFFADSYSMILKKYILDIVMGPN